MDVKHSPEKIVSFPRIMEDLNNIDLNLGNLASQNSMKNKIKKDSTTGCACEHGKRRSQCKDCGGSSICPHGKQKSKCKECGGSSICEHNRQRSQCKQCGGSAICEHSRQKSLCKDCGGNSICPHGRQRSTCKQCGGSSICTHGRRKSQCKDCGGSAICHHQRQRSKCKECSGSSICQHSRQRRQCKECCQSMLCLHNIPLISCRHCAICIHQKQKSGCRECMVCEHNNMIYKCPFCVRVKSSTKRNECEENAADAKDEVPINRRVRQKRQAKKSIQPVIMSNESPICAPSVLPSAPYYSEPIISSTSDMPTVSTTHCAPSFVMPQWCMPLQGLPPHLFHSLPIYEPLRHSHYKPFHALATVVSERAPECSKDDSYFCPPL
mmetsp:Transcript_7153/g.7397  ORF Transcript_7153/g.7397 Transcript_7153/m.7397 type:complete len:381 (+) Transcript_7153:153-1295(+)